MSLTRDQEFTLLECKASDVPALFPDHSPEFLRKRRKALQNATYLQRYHKAYDSNGVDTAEKRWRNSCIAANQRYLARLRELGA